MNNFCKNYCNKHLIVSSIIFLLDIGGKNKVKKKRINSAKSGLHKFHKLIEIYLSISVYVKVPDHLLAVFKL